MEDKIVYPYICAVFGSRMSGIKREVRCKSGAIPVAVSSILSLFILHATVNWNGKAVNNRTSQKTCQVKFSSLRFRVKGRRDIHLLYSFGHCSIAFDEFINEELCSSGNKHIKQTGKLFTLFLLRRCYLFFVCHCGHKQHWIALNF